MEKKLRLMCSYGGHIVPRPHDKTLFYAGGDTRLIAIVLNTATFSFSSLTTHLSAALNLTTPFTIKYQLPHHDLDSLISISNDEDLVNMLDEYDRLLDSPSPARLRFFIFNNNNINENDDEDEKKEKGNVAEDWFMDALKSSGLKNGSGESVVIEDRDHSSLGSTGSSASAGNNWVVGRGGGGCGGGGGGEEIKVALPSLDSLGSDISIPSPNYSQQGIVYQDASGFPESRAISAAHLVETDSNASDRSPRGDMLTPLQVSSYILSKPMDQALRPAASPPPLITGPPHYIHQPALQPHYVTQYYPNSVPVASYPTMYQPYVQAQQPVQYQLSKPHPVYMMPVGQSQNPYDMSVQHNLAPSHNVNPSQHQVPSNPVMVASPMCYEGYKPATPAPESAAKVYRPTTMPAQPVIVSTDDHLHQVVAFPPVSPPSQPVAVSTQENTNYISEYEDPMHAQIYKTQPSGPTLPTQLQTTTNAATVLLAESFTQLKVENTKH